MWPKGWLDQLEKEVRNGDRKSMRSSLEDKIYCLFCDGKHLLPAGQINGKCNNCKQADWDRKGE